MERITDYLRPAEVSCPNKDCQNHGKALAEFPDCYWRFGKTSNKSTRTKSPRYRCKSCKKTFSVPQKSTHRQRKSHRNLSIFLDIVNKTPLKGIARKNRLSMKALYDKIDFIYEQCVAFAANRERELPTITKKWMEIAVDRQTHDINWSSTADKRNIRLYVVASADIKSGYVFGVHVNYDHRYEPNKVEADATACGDYDVPNAFRKYARFWLLGDYQKSAEEAAKLVATRASKQTAAQLVAKTYAEAVARTDVEASDVLDADCRLPPRGMQVHSEYTLYAHFFFLERMFKGVEYVRFYLDQDSGIRAACLAAFAERVLAKDCDAFYVKISKQYTQTQKLALVKGWAGTRGEFVSRNPVYEELTDFSVRRAIIEERLNAMVAVGKWRDKWLSHPFPFMGEPDKEVCYLTNIKAIGFDRTPRELVYMFDRASLHAIDRFFMQVRRAISVLERPISSSSQAGRKWFGGNAYRPDIVVKLLEIFRVYYNYVQINEGKKRRRLKDGEKKRRPGEARRTFTSPAMRLGLAKGPVSEEDILYFVPKKQA